MLVNYRFYIFWVIVVGLLSCEGDGSSIFKPQRIDPPSLEDRTTLLEEENLGRSSWQKPAFIVDKLGDVKDKVIADIGAGTGYFAFHLALLDAKVIAIDIDPQMTQYIDTYKLKLPNNKGKSITTRLAEEDNPMLKNREVDGAIIINTISYIDHLDKYLAILKPAIKSGGRLVIVDYKGPTNKIFTPPQADMVPVLDLILFLENAGYSNIAIDETSLNYQYIVTAITP